MAAKSDSLYAPIGGRATFRWIHNGIFQEIGGRFAVTGQMMSGADDDLVIFGADPKSVVLKPICRKSENEEIAPKREYSGKRTARQRANKFLQFVTNGSYVFS